LAKKLLASIGNAVRFRRPDETKQAVLFSIRFPLNKLPSCVNDALASCGDRPASDKDRSRMPTGGRATRNGPQKQRETTGEGRRRSYAGFINPLKK